MINEFDMLNEVVSIDDKRFLNLSKEKYDDDGYWNSLYYKEYCNAASWTVKLQNKYAEVSSAIEKHEKLLKLLIDHCNHSHNGAWSDYELEIMEYVGIPFDIGRIITKIVESNKLYWILDQYKYYRQTQDDIKSGNYRTLQFNTLYFGENKDGEEILVYRSEHGDGWIVQKELSNGKYEITRISEPDGKKETTICDKKEFW